MKNLITIINLCILFGITTMVARLDKISEEVADTKRETGKIEASPVGMTKTLTASSNVEVRNNDLNDAVASFIKETAQTHMMYLEEGRLASQRGTTRQLKDYGWLMLHDQAEMMEELQKLAALKKVSMDNTLPPHKSGDLKDLSAVHGKDFDKKFMRLMASDQKADVRKFREATRYDDADVQVFATKYLPVVEAHFNKITAIKKSN